MAPKKRPLESLIDSSDCDDNVMPPNLSIAADAKESAFGKAGSMIWKSPAAAKFAAGLYVRTCRRLGIINRTLVASADFDMSKLQCSLSTKSSSKLPSEQPSVNKKRKKEVRRKIPIPSLKQAKSQILQSETVESETELEQKAHRFHQVWHNIRKNGAFSPGWDNKTGELTRVYPSISCHQLLRFMKQNQPVLCDDTPSSNDTIQVLEALVALMVPVPTLYNQPLLVAKVTLTPIRGSQSHELSIGVYANRLLFECMTQELQVVMTALDDSSFQVDQHIQEPPSTTLQTNEFQSAEFPALVFDSEEDDEEYDDADEVAEGSKKQDGKTLSAFSIPGFLKMIENTGTFDSDLWENILEPRLVETQGDSSGLQTELLLHQKHGVCWMYHMERLGNLNRLIWEKRKFHEGDTYYYSPALGQVRLSLSNDAVSTFDTGWGGGGVLSDEMGLGKTVEILALVVATLEDVKQKAREEVKRCATEEDRKSIHHATLIVVPPALLAQWAAEIRKIAPCLVVDSVLYGGDTMQRVQQPSSAESQAKADIVLTTYHALEDNVAGTKKKRSRKRQSSDNELMCLVEQTWGRIVLDEMQEIRSSTSRISKVVNTLKSKCRWMLSGTPLVDDISDLRGELSFLGLEPFAFSNDDGFFDFAVANHWHQRSQYGLSVLQKLAALIILRRSKGMVVRHTGLPLLGLPPMTVTYEPVPQDSSERALYCFLEFVTHSLMRNDATIQRDTDNSTLQAEVQQKKKKKNFLRFLFETCLSPTMLNGGLGCPSQLDTLNRWMKEYNKLLHENKAPQPSRNDPTLGRGSHRSPSRVILSCNEAITFLSQVEDLARTDAEFVTDARVGGDGGVSNRQRAFDTLEVRYERESAELKSTKKQCEKAIRTRAKAYWHLALEEITTGKLLSNDDYCNLPVSSKIRNLWNWRSCALALTSSTRSSKKSLTNKHPTSRSAVATGVLPQMLIRGWRPSDKYFGCSPSRDRDDALMTLFRRESKLYWAHPYTLILVDVPNAITITEIQEALLACLSVRHSVGASDLEVFTLSDRSISEVGSWKAVVRLGTKDMHSYILNKTKTVEGVKLSCENYPEWVDCEITQATTMLEEATAAHRVHPCRMSTQRLGDAKRRYRMAKLGLRIFSLGCGDSGHVQCTNAQGPIRSVTPSTAQGLVSGAWDRIRDSSNYLKSNYSMVQLKERQLGEMKKQIGKGVNELIKNMTTVEVLEALKTGQSEKTLCPICFETHGTGGGLVALTRCGHLSCMDCMTSWIQQKETRMQTPSCIECRKPISYDQLVFVDPKKTGDQDELEKRRVEAKTLVQQAAEMLDNNHGHLEPHLWEALYLAMPLPSSVSHSSHYKYTAIPPLVLAHIRNATSMPVHCTSGQYPDNDQFTLSSKVRALLADIPRDEKSVVFVSSKIAAAHLMAVMKKHGISARGLYGSETEKDSETAVSNWKGSSDIYVLIVQSGVAACGLTLTAARRMFFLHPLRSHEEEKQAYARIHRYGQEKEVFCKVYFAPVSVESRLLEWRHRFENNQSKSNEEKTLFAPLRDVSGETMDNVEAVEADQTKFLLGLT
ncbi:unnamed protein product [Cylindrotheca closterium]|uniref:Uncharacterized protein n=1 Tax=Cylindrotheca closterium TaxID=2856 RepID=A0AAD2CQP4_9STRA|nr:unnamed protein product [Cylindrotheca closterium]